VATRPGYRHRGLVREQIGRFHQVALDRGFDLIIIQGIPYYYRQYGYAYACTHMGRDSIDRHSLLAAGDPPMRLGLRAAEMSDIPLLAQFHTQAMARAQVRTLRDADDWRFLIRDLHYPYDICIRERDHLPVGYVLARAGDGNTPTYLMESCAQDAETASTILRLLVRRHGTDLQVGWPEAGQVVQVSRGLGSGPVHTGQWLLRVPSMRALLCRIGPILERRLAESGRASLTGDVCLNLYQTSYVLRFEGGRLVDVRDGGFVDTSMGADGGDLNIPPDAFVRLVLGFRTLDALRDAWPDTFATPSARELIEILFPPMSSHFWMPYHVFPQS
jgi:hypothetical protein